MERPAKEIIIFQKEEKKTEFINILNEYGFEYRIKNK